MMPAAASNFRFKIFFGGVNSESLMASSRLPMLTDCQLHQTHSDQVVHVLSNSYVTSPGDALFCKGSGFRLWIKTADCLPIALYDETTGEYAMIHAGWRGVASNITVKTLRHFSNPSQVKCQVGPHIQWASFEVSSEIAQEILSSLPKEHGPYLLANLIQPHQWDLKKIRVNLGAVVSKQISLEGIRPENVLISAHDTFTNSAYYSFRRNKTNLRNFSFISRAPA